MATAPESSDGFQLFAFVSAPSEGSQQAHDIVVVFFRCCAAGDDPVEKIGIHTIEQTFKTLELRAVEIS